jgi:uncharacterized protein (DUF169 family)
MTLSKMDFAILEKFNFDVPPVGVKFFPNPPEEIDRLGTNMTFCEMLKWAQTGNVFYADKENHTCGAGPFLLGLTDPSTDSPRMINGELAAALKVFEDTRSASRLYRYLPRLDKGTVSSVAFSPSDKLAFDPDILVILARTDQTEVLLRAMSYRTGMMWSSKSTAVIGCAWLFIYPYISGELNYTVTGLSHGMKRRKLFPEGMQLVSIPFDLLPSMLRTLNDMPWVLPSMGPDGDEFFKQVITDLRLV